MWRSFSLFILCALSMQSIGNTKDLLYYQVLKYNNIKEQPAVELTIDSIPIHLIQNTNQQFNKNKTYNKQIIKKRPVNNDYLLLFSIFLVLALLVLARASSKVSFQFQLLNYIKIRSKHFEKFGIFKVIVTNLLFIFLMAYICYYFFNFRQAIGELAWPLFMKIFIGIAIVIFYKYVLSTFIAKVFHIKQAINVLQYYWLEMISIFVSISLPIVLISAIGSSPLSSIIFMLLFAFIVLLYFVLIVKFLYTELSIVRSNVINSIIYFYLVEIIPIVLFLNLLTKTN
jgi:hypothetical protein